MSLKLACDHCHYVISEDEFREVKVSPVFQNASQPGSGFTKSEGVDYHYHVSCLEARDNAALPSEEESEAVTQEFSAVPEGHPLVQSAYRQT